MIFELWPFSSPRIEKAIMWNREKALLVIGVLVLIVVVWAIAKYSDRAVPPAPPTDLKDFAGVIDHSNKTYDKVLSRLKVEASRALEAGDVKNAEEIYREIVRQYPKNASAYEALGTCLGFQKRYDESGVEYFKALELNPRSAEALRGLGCNEYEQNRDNEAVTFLEKSLAIENHGLAHWTLALIYERKGEPVKAIAQYELAISSKQIGVQAQARGAERVKALK